MKNGIRLVGGIFVVTIVVIMALSAGHGNMSATGPALGALSALLIGTLVYFIPSFVAHYNGNPQLGLVFLVNLFLGWSVIGWMAAFVWAAAGAPDRGTNNA